MSTKTLELIITIFRLWIGPAVFDLVEQQFDTMTRADLSGKEKRDAVIAAVQRKFKAAARSLIKVAIALLWARLKLPEEER